MVQPQKEQLRTLKKFEKLFPPALQPGESSEQADLCVDR